MSSSRDAVGGRCACACISAASAAERVDQLRAAAVIQRQRERGSGVARGQLGRPAHLVLHFGGQLVRAPDVADAHVVVHHALHVALEVALQQPHQEVDFGAGPAQVVLQRKGVERQPGQADARGGFRDQLHALRALLVAQKALQRAVPRPAAIAVHDDGHMLGQALGLQRRIDGALLRGQLIDAQRARWMQGSRLFDAFAACGARR